MNKTIKKTSIILTCGFALFACKKNKDVSGTIRDFGPIELDGCGWVIEIGSETFKPINLSSQFQQDQLEVELTYNETGNMANCGLQPNAFMEIEIDEIE